MEHYIVPIFNFFFPFCLRPGVAGQVTKASLVPRLPNLFSMHEREKKYFSACNIEKLEWVWGGG